MKKLIHLLLFVIISSYAFTQDSVTTIDMLRQHIQFLASDELEGRYPGTEGLKKAEDYIASQFQNIGLDNFKGSYRQELQIATNYIPGEKCAVSFNVLIEKPGVPKEMWKSLSRTWQTGTDWLPVNFSEDGMCAGEMAFAGYGITAKDLKYDDYENMDVKGKIVIVLSHSPDGSNEEGQFAAFIRYRYKAMNAREHGAVGIIFIKINSDSANVFEPLLTEPAGRYSGIIAIQANRTSIAKFFPRDKALFPLEQKINSEKKPQSFYIPNARITINVELKDKYVPSANIAGFVKGTDPALSNEYIIVGAHYDHLGWGGPTSMYKVPVDVYGGKLYRIHNGADDNASGTAGLIELARRMKQMPARRSVLFIAFTGEELGLRGSKYYTENPLVPLENTVCMLNMDMIGRLQENKLTIFGAGTSAGFSGMLDSLALLDSITVSQALNGFGPSDHSSFYQNNLPVLMYFTGVHEDYHKPSDDWEKINFKGLQHVLKYIESALRTIGNLDEKPSFIKVEGVADREHIKTYGDGGAWFGIVPNFEECLKGCKISGASPGSPAEKAGLQPDDVITKFDDKTIKNLHDLTYAIREKKPGDLVKVTILRGKNYEKVLTVEVKLTTKK